MPFTESVHDPGAGADAPGVLRMGAALATMGDADGYTLAVMHNSVLRWPHMNKVEWDRVKDFTEAAGALARCDDRARVGP